MACATPIYDFCLDAGRDKEKKFLWKDVDGVEKDLSGKTITLNCPSLSYTSAATITDPSSGEFYFTFVPVDTADKNLGLKYRSFPYEITDDTDNRVLFKGVIIIYEGV